MLNEKMVELKREILVTIAGVEELGKFKGVDYPIVEPDDVNGYDMEMVKQVIFELVQEGLITDNVTGAKVLINKIENATIFLTEKGNELAEHWSNDDRWKDTISICGKLRDFSTRTVHMVYDELERAEMYNLLPATPLVKTIDGIISELCYLRSRGIYR